MADGLVAGGTPGLCLIWSEDPEALGVQRGRLYGTEDRGAGCRRLEVIHTSPGLFLGASRYPGYPIVRIEDSRFIILREGALFGANGVPADEVSLHIAAAAWDGNRKELERLLVDTDGEFLMVTVCKTEPGFVVVCDVRGRLPAYMSLAARAGVLSRDRRTVAAVAGLTDVNRMAVAQFLTLSCVLGTGTLVEGMERLPPAGVVRWTGRGRAAVDVLFPPDWTNMDVTRDPVGDLVDLFRDAVRKRVHGFNLVSLSGGFDSRATAAALSAEKCNVRAVTYVDPQGQAGPEVPIARSVAERLGLPWSLYEIDSVRSPDLRELLAMKFGANPLSMTFVVPFLRSLRSDFGTGLTQFTGDGGWILKDLRPTRPLRSIPAVVQYALQRKSVFPASVACKLAGVTQGEFNEVFVDCIAGYGEDRPEFRYIRFLWSQMGTRFHFEGEDRNRCYFWSTSPFYGLDFFRMAVAVPQREKAGLQFYAKFLERLAPEVARLPHATGPAAGSVRLRLTRSARRMAFRSALVEGFYRSFRPGRPSAGDPMVVNHLRSHVAGCEAVRDQLSAGELDRLVAHPDRFSAKQLLTLLTVTSCLETLATGSSTLGAFESANSNG